MIIDGRLNNQNLKTLFLYVKEQGITGSLSVSDGSSEKLVFFEPGTIKLFSIGERKRVMLGEVLLLIPETGSGV